MNTEIPDSWGKDPLSGFIESAHQNIIATFQKFRESSILAAVCEIDNLFHLATTIKYGQDERLLPNFVGRCHCTYLGAIRLSTSGQVVEAYMVIRGCLENALYALYIDNDPVKDEEPPDRTVTWLNRGKDKESTKKCRNMFTYGTVRNNLIEQDEILGQEASLLYDRTIDYGAHPNFYGHITTSDVTKVGVTVQFLMPGTNAFKLCVQTSVEVGICSLKIFNRIFSERFHSAGITERLNKINEEWRGR